MVHVDDILLYNCECNAYHVIDMKTKYNSVYYC